MNPDILATISKLHAAWNAATGQDLKLISCDYEREWGYHQFIKSGFSEHDIYTVVRYIRRKIKEGKRLDSSLKWSNCIGNITRFAEDLAMAHAEARNAKPPMTPKQRAVEQLRPTAVTLQPQDTVNTAKPISHWIEQLRSAAQ